MRERLEDWHAWKKGVLDGTIDANVPEDRLYNVDVMRDRKRENPAWWIHPDKLTADGKETRPQGRSKPPAGIPMDTEVVAIPLQAVEAAVREMWLLREYRPHAQATTMWAGGTRGEQLAAELRVDKTTAQRRVEVGVTWVHARLIG